MNVVVTNLLTKVKDPSRRTFMRSHPDMFAALRDSVEAHGQRLVILHDCLHVQDDEPLAVRLDRITQRGEHVRM